MSFVVEIEPNQMRLTDESAPTAEEEVTTPCSVVPCLLRRSR